MTTQVQQEAEEILAAAQSSLGALFEWRVSTSATAEAYRYPKGDDWVSLTWKETRDWVFELAAGLLALGLQSEERVAIASSTRIEWVLTDLAINCAGGATTTVYPNTVGEDFRHILRHSGSRYFVAENAEQLAKLTSLDAEAKAGVRKAIVLEGSGSDDTVTFDELRQLGRDHLAENPDAVRNAIDAAGHGHLATLIYTSGTTGLPKGVELTHRNWVYEAEAIRRLDLIEPGSVQYFWLPLSHVFGKTVMVAQLSIGFSSAIDGRLDKIVGGLGTTHPDFMCGAPRIFEKVRNAVRTSSAQGAKARIARWAFATGRQSHGYRLSGRPLPRGLAIRYALADRLVFSKLRHLMGGNIRFFVSGSAKLSAQVQEWFYSAGIIVIEGYGLTETSAVTAVDHPKSPRFGTVGRPVPGTEVRIAEDGEVLVRGPGVMRGYHDAPDLTAEAIDPDGWFHTGDIGNLDADGYLSITDRKKDLMKTSGGKYVAPQKVESALTANVPYVSQAVAVGDGRKYVSALLTLDPGNLEKWAKQHNLEGTPYAELTQLPELRASLDGFVAQANSKLEKWETVKRYAILDHELSVEEGDVTASMKLRRSAIAKSYADVVESLYDAED